MHQKQTAGFIRYQINLRGHFASEFPSYGLQEITTLTFGIDCTCPINFKRERNGVRLDESDKDSASIWSISNMTRLYRWAISRTTISIGLAR